MPQLLLAQLQEQLGLYSQLIEDFKTLVKSVEELPESTSKQEMLRAHRRSLDRLQESAQRLKGFIEMRDRTGRVGPGGHVSFDSPERPPSSP